MADVKYETTKTYISKDLKEKIETDFHVVNTTKINGVLITKTDYNNYIINVKDNKKPNLKFDNKFGGILYYNDTEKKKFDLMKTLSFPGLGASAGKIYVTKDENDKFKQTLSESTEVVNDELKRCNIIIESVKDNTTTDIGKIFKKYSNKINKVIEINLEDNQTSQKNTHTSLPPPPARK